ncbi:MAG: heparinase II/III family protein [Sphingomonas sp.]
MRPTGLRRFQLPAFARDPAELIADAGPERFEWYSMAVGLRVARLAYLADAAARRPEVPDAAVLLMIRSVKFHQRLLASPAFFKAHNNHGVCQALGLLASARRFAWMRGMRAKEKLALRELRGLIEAQFHADGFHREHSPGYHHTVLGWLGGRGRRRPRRRERGSAVAIGAHAGALGDARRHPRSVRRHRSAQHPAHARARRAILESELRYLMTDGEAGSPPATGVSAFPESGYAVARLFGGKPADASYLAQLAAFHSRVHKQADHLTFVWHEGQRAILTDPGRYGYAGKTSPGDGLWEQGFWYSAPERVYVESTAAHNCVEIDGRSYPRRIRPFGSALRQADLQDGMAVFDSEVRHPGGVRQRRTLILAPGEFLVVLDWLHDRSRKPHAYRQCFTFAPAIEMEAADFGFRSLDRTVSVAELLGATPGPVRRGQSDPIAGWVSDEPYHLVPASSISFGREGATVTFATVISLSPMIEPLPVTRTSTRTTVLAWKAPATRRLTITRHDRVQVSRDR